METTSVSPANEETRDAWDGVLFDRWLQFRDIVTTGLRAHGDRALALYPPSPGDRVLDLGCGLGDTSQQMAGMVGPEGEVVGIDFPNFIEAARKEAEEAGLPNLSFMVGDVEVTEFEGTFDRAFSRFGTMFYANPVRALRNVRSALVPGGRLCMVVWRQKVDNEWLHTAEQVVEQFVTEPEESDEPTCGPGPFSMAGADTVSDILLGSGFEDLTFHRTDIDIAIGADLDGAVEFVMALGPAGEVIRLAGDEADKVRPKIAAALREVLAQYETPEGVIAPASTWVVAAKAPDEASAS